jgi:hypothetical protein
MCKETQTKKNRKKQFITAGIIFFLYFAWHFDVIYYAHKPMLVLIGFVPFFEVHGGYQNGIIFGSHELNTSFGTVTIRPFCSFSARGGMAYSY